MSDSEDNATGGSEMKPAKSLYLPGEKGAIGGVKPKLHQVLMKTRTPHR